MSGKINGITQSTARFQKNASFRFAMVLLGLSALQGCELALAPIVIGGEAIVDTVVVQSSIVQPVAVIEASGKALAGPSGPSQKPESTLQLTGSAISCSGRSTGSETFSLRCNNGWKTDVKAAGRGPGIYDAVNRVGHQIRFSFNEGKQISTSCSGNYIAPADEEGPFLIKCTDYKEEWADFNKTKRVNVGTGSRTGAVAITQNASGSKQINIWLGPAT